MSTTAQAHPNIALIKYWGKQTGAGNMPATPSISITLSDLLTTTQVCDAAKDHIVLNGEEVQDHKVSQWLVALREQLPVPYLQIDTSNNFPTGAGLASSASGFAALITAINQHCALGLNQEMCSDWARLGSASAARSILGGFVALVPPQWLAKPLAPSTDWPLRVVIAITSHDKKAVSSTEGMERSRQTSAFYPAWIRGAVDDYTNAANAVSKRDFALLSTTAETNCLKMHSVMLTSQPTLSYWTPASLACMDTVRRLRAEGSDVFFTMDAGPQVKAVCLPESEAAVAAALSAVPGVLEVQCCGLGGPAGIIDS